MCKKLNVPCPAQEGRLLEYSQNLGNATKDMPLNSIAKFMIDYHDDKYPVFCIKFMIKSIHPLTLEERDQEELDSVYAETFGMLM